MSHLASCTPAWVYPASVTYLSLISLFITCVPSCLFISLSGYLNVYPPVSLPVSLSPVYLDCLFIHLPTCLPTRLSVYLPAYLCTYLTTCLFSPPGALPEKPTTEQQRALLQRNRSRHPASSCIGHFPHRDFSLTTVRHPLPAVTHRCLCVPVLNTEHQRPRGPKSGERRRQFKGYI